MTLTRLREGEFAQGFWGAICFVWGIWPTERGGGEKKMRDRKWNRRGQSILEYLIVAVLVITAVIAMQFVFKGSVESMQTQASGRTTAAGVQLGTVTGEAR